MCALLAAVAYGVASVLQAAAARAVDDDGAAGIHPRLLIRVLGQWRYVLGLSMDALGFLAQLAALRVLPLFVVQAALAASLAVTAVAAIGIGARLRGLEWAAIMLVCVGLGLLGASAQSEASGHVGLGFHLALAVATVAVAGAGALAGHAPGRVRSPALGLVAGLCFALVAVAGRVLDTSSIVAVLTDPAAYTIAGAGIVGMVFYASALQCGSVTTATALMVVGETVLPSVIGVVALGDATRPGFALVAVAGFALAVVSALALTRFGEIEPSPS